MQRSEVRRSMALVLAIFAGFCLANGFFWWSFPAWFSLFGDPDGLINPAVDKWLIGPLAVIVYVIQYPSYKVVERTSWWASGPPAPALVLASLLSTSLYAPLILWIKRTIKRRAA